MPVVHSIAGEEIRGPLAEIASPPRLLHCAGDLGLLEAVDGVAVVGTRRPSHEEARLSHAIGRALATAGIPVISGLALGVDGEAHRGCLESGGRTIAFLGSGMRRIHPRRHLSLAGQIVARGGLVCSEVGHDEAVRPQHLVARNRLVSGLSIAVIVVSSSAEGGTMHTVRFAVQQGRQLWCPQKDGIGGSGVRLLLEEPSALAMRKATPLQPLRKERISAVPLASAFDPSEAGLRELIRDLQEVSSG